MTSIGPSQAPIAAISLTSPAPMPPSAYNGSQSAVATVHPSRLLPAPATPPVDAETKTAAAAAPSVSALGIRRRERSNPHAANPMRIAIESCTFMAYRQLRPRFDYGMVMPEILLAIFVYSAPMLVPTVVSVTTHAR